MVKFVISVVNPVNCTQNTQPFGSGCGFWVSKGTYPKPIPKYSKNPIPIPIPKTHTQILKKSHTHTQNPYPNTQKIPYPHPKTSHTKYSFNLTVYW